jgi:hypothetical protein
MGSHAILGYAFLIDGGAVSWSSHKQELVTLSTAGQSTWRRRMLPRRQARGRVHAAGSELRIRIKNPQDGHWRI